MCPQMPEETKCYRDVSPGYERGMKIRNQMWFGSHLGCHFHIQADKITECWWGCGIIAPPLPGWWGYKLLQTFQRTVLLDPSGFWMDLVMDPALLLSEIFPKDVISRGHQEMDTKSFFGGTIYKKKKFKTTSVRIMRGLWNELRYIHSVQFSPGDRRMREMPVILCKELKQWLFH